jgi:hypothetical protein
MHAWVALVALPGLSVAACPGTGAERYEARTFLGYACDGDCEEHKSGYAWAGRHGITHAGACNLPRARMREGCRAFAEGRLSPLQAGFEWALENEVVDPCECQGAGPAFETGCRGFLRLGD